MGELIPQEHGGAVNRFRKGEVANPNGRPKKIHTILKDSGYSKDDIKDAFEEIGWQTIDDLQEILNDDSKPVILKVIARAFIKGAEKGDFRYVSEILMHIIGKPKESLQVNAEVTKKFIVQFGNNSAIQSAPGSVEGDQ